MQAPPIILDNSPRPSRGAPLSTKVAFWLLIGINAEVFLVSLVLAGASTKSEGVLWASLIFGAPVIAPLVAVLALPAVRRYPLMVLPRVTLALGIAPLPMMFLAYRAAAFLGL